MSVHDTVHALVQAIRSVIAALWLRHENNEISKDEFLDLAVAFLDTEIRRAEVLADLAVSAELTRLRGEIVPPTGRVSEPDPEHTREILIRQEDVQRHDADPATSYGVAGSAMALDAYQEQTTTVMVEQEVAMKFRSANPGACAICQNLDGQELPVDAEPYHHKGCACVFIPFA